MEVSIKATIDDLNQYLQGNVTAQGLIITLEDLLNFIKDSEGIYENKTMENLNEGKKKASAYMAELAEIDKQSAIVAMEAKIDKLAEMVETKNARLSMVSEDENLSELIDKKQVKMMEKEIKEIEKAKMKLEKLYEKMSGGKKKEVVKEEDPVDEGHGMDSMYDEDDSVSEGGYGMPSYEEDDDKPSMEEELDEAHCNTEEDDVREETNEEVNRWQKLAGL